MSTQTSPVVAARAGAAEGILHRSLDPQSDSIEHLFLHLRADGERTTLVLLPSEARDIRDVLNTLFSEVSGEEADRG